MTELIQSTIISFMLSVMITFPIAMMMVRE